MKAAAEKARFIATLTTETKRLKTQMASQRTALESKVANLEMRLAKVTKEKSTETLALQDLRETCEDQAEKIKQLEKDALEKPGLLTQVESQHKLIIEKSSLLAKRDYELASMKVRSNWTVFLCNIT
jgi:hypothetical protein